MSITSKDVEKVAALAKLQFTPDEHEKLALQLDKIVAYVDKLNELDLEHVEPTSHILGPQNVFREDETMAWFESSEASLANAPKAKHGYFSVPKTVDKDAA